MNKGDFQMLQFWKNRGMVPDWYWYQVNGQSPNQNLEQQRQQFLERIGYFDDTPTEIKFTFESKVKK